jgi:hypothetical protein
MNSVDIILKYGRHADLYTPLKIFDRFVDYSIVGDEHIIQTTNYNYNKRNGIVKSLNFKIVITSYYFLIEFHYDQFNYAVYEAVELEQLPDDIRYLTEAIIDQVAIKLKERFLQLQQDRFQQPMRLFETFVNRPTELLLTDVDPLLRELGKRKYNNE